MARVTGWLRSHRAAIAFTILAAGNLLGWRALEAGEDARRADQVVADAHRCVDQHERVGLLRQVIEDSVSEGSAAGAGAVLDVATQLAEEDEPVAPEAAQLLADAAAQRAGPAVEAITSRYPDPECSLGAARRVLTDR